MIYRICINNEDIYGTDLDNSVISPSLEIELNSAGSLNFTLPPEHVQWDKPNVFVDEVDVYEDDDIIWFGRPLQVTRDWNNQKKVICEGALAYFNDSVQRPKEYKLKNTTLRQFFEDIIDMHNLQVATNRKIYPGNFTVDDVPVYRKVDYETTAECLQRYCLDTDGGYFILRKERNPEDPTEWLRYIDWVADLQGRSDQPVQFGLNMLDIAQDLNGADICTVLIPTGGDDLLVNNVATQTVNGCRHVKGEDEIVFVGAEDPTNPEGIHKYGRVLKQKEWSDIYDKDQLFQKACEWLVEQNTDIPTIECAAADLHYLPEYEDQYGSETGKFRVGQKVHVVSSVHGIGSEYVLPMFKISMNLDSGVKRITIGTPPKRELTDIIAPGTSGGSTRSSGKSSGSGGGGGSTYIPVVDVLTKVPGAEAYKSVVTKKKAKIDLSELGGGDVSDVTVNGTSVVDPETKVAEVVIPPPPAVPVQDVQVDNVSVVDQNGVANLDSDDFGTKVQANPQGTPQAHLSTIGIDGNVYDIPGSGGGTVTDVQVGYSNRYESVLDENGVAKLGTLATFVAPNWDDSQPYAAESPNLSITAYQNKTGYGWENPEQQLLEVKEICYTKKGNTNSGHFNMVDYFQRSLLWDDCFKIYPKRDGDYYKMAVGMNGNGDYPLLGLNVKGEIGEYVAGKDSPSIGNEVPTLNFIGQNGIKTNVYGPSVSQFHPNGQIDVTLSYDDNFKPFSQLVFADTEMIDEEAGTNIVYYDIEETGSYAILLVVETLSDYSGTSISISGNNNQTYQNLYNTWYGMYTTNDGSSTYYRYYRAQIILGKFTAGTQISFIWKHGDIQTNPERHFKNNGERLVFKLNNMDLSGAQSILSYGKAQYTTQDLHSVNYAYNKSVLTFECSLNHGGYNRYGDDIYSTYSSTSIDDFFSSNGYLYPNPYSGSYNNYQVHYENSPSITSQKTLHVDHVYRSSSVSSNSHQSAVFAFSLPIINYQIPTGYVTVGDLNAATSQLQSNFQDGVDDIYQACISKGSTPVSYSLADVIDGVLNIPQSSDATPPMYTLRMILDDGVGKATTNIDGRYGMYIPLRSDGTYNLPFGTDPDSFKIRIKFKFDDVTAGSKTEIGLCGSYNGDWFGLPIMYVHKVGSQYVIWGGVGASNSAWDASVEVDYAIASNTWYIYDLIWNRGFLMAKLYDEAGNLLGDAAANASNSFYINQSAYFQFGGVLNNNTVFASEKGLSIDILQTYVDVDSARVFGADIIGNARGVYIETESYSYPTPAGIADSSINATATITTTAMEGS